MQILYMFSWAPKPGSGRAAAPVALLKKGQGQTKPSLLIRYSYKPEQVDIKLIHRTQFQYITCSAFTNTASELL